MEKLLQDLSILETCTQEALKQVRIILRDVEVNKGDIGSSKRIQARGKPSESSDIPPTTTPTGNNTVARSAQKIVKVCLVSLSSLGRKAVHPSTDSSSVTPENNLKKKARRPVSQKSPIPTQETCAGHVVSQCCNIALESWSKACKLDDTNGLLTVLRARCNFLVRLLDAGMVMLEDRLPQSAIELDS